MLTKLDRDVWRWALQRSAMVVGVTVTIAFGVIVTFAWIGLLARGFGALIALAI